MNASSDLVLLSLRQAAEIFDRNRKSLGKRIRELGIRPAKTRHGNPVYRFRDLLEAERKYVDRIKNPDTMTPFERQAHFKAESERLKVNEMRGALLEREAVEEEWARVLRAVALELDTMVDEIERDIGANPLVLKKIASKVDVIRERMYQHIAFSEASS